MRHTAYCNTRRPSPCSCRRWLAGCRCRDQRVKRGRQTGTDALQAVVIVRRHGQHTCANLAIATTHASTSPLTTPRALTTAPTSCPTRAHGPRHGPDRDRADLCCCISPLAAGVITSPRQIWSSSSSHPRSPPAHPLPRTRSGEPIGGVGAIELDVAASLLTASKLIARAPSPRLPTCHPALTSPRPCLHARRPR